MRVLLIHNQLRSATPSGETASSSERAKHSREVGTTSCGSGETATRLSRTLCDARFGIRTTDHKP